MAAQAVAAGKSVMVGSQASAGLGAIQAASFAVQFGARVAIVEKQRIGGDCTWTGCVPSKTLLKTSKVAHQIRRAERYGLSPAEPPVDFFKIAAPDSNRRFIADPDHHPAGMF